MTVATAPSHRVSQNGDRVVIHGLELFVGYDPELDGSDDKRMKKYTPERISEVVNRTNSYMARGQRPKLILGHNTDDESDFAKPVVGDILEISEREIFGVAGIVGDVSMSVDDFEAYVKSNRYPRRSAEIWADGYMSEVALLGSETPARPLPDTRFGRMSRNTTHVDRFARDFAKSEFMLEPTATPHGPGDGNTHIPSSDAKDKAMADDTTKDDDLKAKLKAAMDEIEDLKAKLKAKNSADEDADGKEKEKAAKIAAERDQFQRQVKEQNAQIASLRKDMLLERYGRMLETEIRGDANRGGLKVENAEQFAKLCERIVSAADPDAEFEFIRDNFARVPVRMRIDQTGVELIGTDASNGIDREAKAAEAAKEEFYRLPAKEQTTERFQSLLRDKLSKAG